MTQGICSFPLFAFNYVTHAMCNSFTIFDLFDDAIADLLGMITYRHGTSAKSVYSIMWTGGQPRLGGRVDSGESAQYFGKAKPNLDGHVMDCRNRFFVVRDVLPMQYNQKDSYFDYLPCTDNCAGKDEDYAWQKSLSRYYTHVATQGEMFVHGYSEACVGEWSYCLSGATPTVKFRFRPDQIASREQPFFNDMSYVDICHRPPERMPYQFTTQPITPDHLGIYGTLAHGLSGNICENMSADPERYTRGLYKLAWAVMLSALVILGLTLSPLTALLVAPFLLYETAIFIGTLALPLISGCCNTPQLEELA